MAVFGFVSLTKHVDGKLRLDQEVLADFFGQEEFQGKPMSIISVGGARGTEKSILLQFFLRYLESKGWEEPNWIADETTECLSWTGDVEPHIPGIQVWEKPYVVKGSNNKEIVIVIMKTQGLFDQDMSKADTVKLLSLSAIASSFQIVTTKGAIGDNELENLQFYVEYGEEIAKKELSKYMQLQSLLMLVQHWKYKDSYSFGFEGGKKYFESTLAKKSPKFLHKTPEDVRCFLMPHQDVTENEMVATLCNNIFLPDNLVIKMSGDQAMTSSKLVRILGASDEVLFDNKSTPFPALVEAYAKTHYEDAYIDCMELYETKMQVLLSDEEGSPRALDQLDAVHQEAFSECVAKYKSYEDIGSGRYKNQYNVHLRSQCRDYCDIMKEKMKVHLDDIESLMQQKVSDAKYVYESKMSRSLSGTFLTEEKFTAIHDKLFNECCETFDHETSKYGKIAKSHKKSLESAIEVEREKKKEENKKIQEIFQQAKNTGEESEIHRDREKNEAQEVFKKTRFSKAMAFQSSAPLTILKHEDLRETKIRLRMLILRFNRQSHRRFELRRYVDWNVLADRFDDFKIHALETYEEETEDEDETLKNEIKKELEHELEKQWSLIEKTNEEKLKNLKETLDKQVQKFVTTYKDTMHHFVHKKHFKKEALIGSHEHVKQVLMEKVELRYVPLEIVNSFKSKVSKCLDFEFEEIKEKNEKYKSWRTETIVKAIAMCVIEGFKAIIKLVIPLAIF